MGNLSNLEDKADRLWQQLQYARWGGRCAKCGNTRGLSGHHLVKRRFMATRWLAECGILLCEECHTIAETMQARFDKWLERRFPHLWKWKEVNSNPPIQVRYKDTMKLIIRELEHRLKQEERVCSTSSY